ncbi:hypothetical protein EB796_012432 [Bugula neritina]|uniref:Maltase n=1 Tax=Bugula neritina TaxID=10212 RepID=A0A7J7JSC6_BUGNE|nr:hypothetical protein EB796_012432 [Bugula neritina]
MGTNHSSPTINTETNTDLAHDLLNNNSVKRQTSDQPVESHLRSTGRAESRTGRRSKSAERPRLNITATSSRSSPSTPTLLTRRRVHSPPATLAVDSIILDRKSNNSSKSSGKRRTKKSPQSILLADDGPYYRLTRCSDDEVSFHREKTELLLEAVNTSPAAAIASQSRGSLISPLKLDLMCETESRLHFKIYDPHKKRFEVQESMLGHSLPEFTKKAHHTQYSVEYSRRPFGLTVTRKSTGFVIFNSCEVGKLQFNDEKIQFSTSVLSKYLYGLGEHQKTFLIDTHNHSHNFVFWSRDQPPKKEHNLYGCHPFFLALETDGNAYGVFLLNSSAMEVDIKPGDPPILTYTVSGGILDLYIFTGPSPIEVVQQYQEVIGFSHLPPYWALGFHLSRWGYDSVTELNKTIDANRRAAICYESQWTDIDMMKDRQSWTFSHSDLVSTVHNLQLNGQRYVNIIVSFTYSTLTIHSITQSVKSNKSISGKHGILILNLPKHEYWRCRIFTYSSTCAIFTGHRSRSVKEKIKKPAF